MFYITFASVECPLRLANMAFFHDMEKGGTRKHLLCMNKTRTHMKRTIPWAVLLVLVLVCPLAGTAQSPDIPTVIATALGQGDASGLSAYFNDNVELVVGSKNDIFSKQQSHGILSEFFRKNRVNRFNVLHKGERDLSCFIIGTLETDYATYRVYVLTRKNENQNLIQQLRIEPSNE